MPDLDSILTLCRSFPDITEDMPWPDDLCFKIRGKIFASIVWRGRPRPRALAGQMQGGRVSPLYWPFIRRCITTCAAGVWNNVSEQINKFEPTCGLQQDQPAPQIAVLPAIPLFPVPHCHEQKINRPRHKECHARKHKRQTCRSFHKYAWQQNDET